MKKTIVVEYCPKCGWLLRSAYMAQELLTTFANELNGLTLKPSEIAGTFTVKVDDKLIFDRKEMQRFPEIKELKRLVRDEVNPEMDLGHTDKV